MSLDTLLNVEFVPVENSGLEFINQYSTPVEIGTLEDDGVFYPMIYVDTGDKVVITVFTGARKRMRLRKVRLGRINDE